MKIIGRLFLAAALVILPLSMASAATVTWTDWTTADSGQVTGVLNFSGGSVGVTYTGPYYFAQTSGGTNYWTNPSIYTLTGVVDNAPPDSDIIALGSGGSKTITFSQPVQDIILALVSWNGNIVDFGVPITILNYGAGYWGSGTPVLNATGTGFTGEGEVHGIIEILGIHTSITFTDTTEYWHGFTVGAMSSVAATPIPSSLMLMASGLMGLLGLARKFN